MITIFYHKSDKAVIITPVYLQVVDNGTGMSFDDVNLVGSRHATSKIPHSDSLPKQPYCYGRKGTALASIAAISETLEITTRYKLSANTYTKAFHHGKQCDVVECELCRPSAGTTVTVHGLFYNLPVRRRSMCEAMVMVKVTRAVSALALLHPTISFSVRDNQTGECSLQTSQVGSVPRTFAQLFGSEYSQLLKHISVSHNGFEISGYMSTNGHINNTLQFLYLNGRPVQKTLLHSHLNTLLTKHLFSSDSTQNTNTVATTRLPHERYGVYILNVQCSISKYEMCHEPSRTLLEFSDWTDVRNALQLLVKTFLEENNVTTDFTKDKTTSSTLDFSHKLPNFKSDSLLDSKCGVQSQTVRRCSTGLADLSTSDSCLTTKPSFSPVSCLPASHLSSQHTLSPRVPHLSTTSHSNTGRNAVKSVADFCETNFNTAHETPKPSGFCAVSDSQKTHFDSTFFCAKATRHHKCATTYSSTSISHKHVSVNPYPSQTVRLSARLSRRAKPVLTSDATSCSSVSSKSIPLHSSKSFLSSQIGFRLSSLHSSVARPVLTNPTRTCSNENVNFHNAFVPETSSLLNQIDSNFTTKLSHCQVTGIPTSGNHQFVSSSRNRCNAKSTTPLMHSSMFITPFTANRHDLPLFKDTVPERRNTQPPLTTVKENLSLTAIRVSEHLASYNGYGDASIAQYMTSNMMLHDEGSLDTTAASEICHTSANSDLFSSNSGCNQHASHAVNPSTSTTTATTATATTATTTTTQIQSTALELNAASTQSSDKDKMPVREGIRGILTCWENPTFQAHDRVSIDQREKIREIL